MARKKQANKFVIEHSGQQQKKSARRSTSVRTKFSKVLNAARLKHIGDVLPRQKHLKAYFIAAGRWSTDDAVNALRAAAFHYVSVMAREAQTFMGANQRLKSEHIDKAARALPGFFTDVHMRMLGKRDPGNGKAICPIVIKGRAPSVKEARQATSWLRL
jgi:hypothetical protein